MPQGHYSDKIKLGPGTANILFPYSYFLDRLPSFWICIEASLDVHYWTKTRRTKFSVDKIFGNFGISVCRIFVR